MRHLHKGLILGLLLIVPAMLWPGTTGKIAGTVTDAESGEPLPGANVVIAGTALGSAADLSGNYTILHVPPDIYDIQVSMMGYASMTVTKVRVRIDQTARVNAKLTMEALEGEAVTVVADKNIVKDDVATSVVAVSAAEVEELPVGNVRSVVGLQAGVQGDMEIRGGESGDALLLMDGVTLRDPRNNAPISNVALSSVQEISIERGGFNAEYGQVRSGIVNVVTKEGKRSYHGSVELKYSPPGEKHFGISPFDPESNWLKPYYDDDVCWTGTGSGAWDKWTQRQYPDFEGWNAVSERLMSDDNPDNDLSPAGAQQVFMWETRKQPANDQPDYNIDAGFGGPVPFLNDKLGNLRFFTSYRKLREMLLVPLTREDYQDYDWTLKLTSDISSSMKLTINSLVGKQYMMQDNWSDAYIRYPSSIARRFSAGDRGGSLFGTGYFSLADIGHKSFSAKLTHILNQDAFYEVSIEHVRRNYYTHPPEERDQETLYEAAPGYYVDEAPYGYDWNDELGVASMLFGGFTCKRRDNSNVSSTTLKADMTNQVNFNNLVKMGVEYVYNELDLDYGVIANYSSSRFAQRTQLNVKPQRAAVYVQDKMETKGFIMNIGLRLDYSHSNTDWWDIDPYDDSFFGTKYSPATDYEKLKSEGQWQFSPRLGISHPITESSKLFFNYGHFKQMPSYETLFRLGRSTSGQMLSYGDPNISLAKTISYELGYDHSLFNDYLFQLAAFYHDVSDQQNNTNYTSISGLSYSRTTSNSYRDTRGFELSFRKNRGRWWTFFGNYTYQVTSSGNFGRQEIYEDPSRQKEYDENTTNLYQLKPVPRPYARFNLSLYTPEQYGPEMAGFYPMGGFMLNFLMNWQAGQWVTYNPKSIASVNNNVQETDYFDATLRFSKTIRFNRFRILAFVDVSNVFNYKRMSMANFNGKNGDIIYYRESLHLPDSDDYDNIPGDDRFGSYRKEGVDYQPMIWQGTINYDSEIGEDGVIYYDDSSARYVEYVDETWVDIEKGRLNQILDDKAYIDMPNQDSFTFLNPRRIFFGARLSFDLN